MTVATTVADDQRQAPLVVRKRKHPGRWVFTAVVIVVAFFILRVVVTNPTYEWSVVWDYMFSKPVMDGIVVTLWLTLAAMGIGAALGTVLAIMRLSPVRIVSSVAWAYIWFFRGTPVLVQLYFWFNLAALVPNVTIGIPGLDPFYSESTNTLVTPFLAAALGLGLAEGAYYAEIVRAGILSVDAGQTEAARAFGLTRMQTMRRIILPQAMRVIIPPTGNQLIGMLKWTSIASVISVAELTQSVTVVYAKNFQVIPLLMVAALWYLVGTSILTVGQHYLEKYYAPSIVVTRRRKRGGSKPDDKVPFDVPAATGTAVQPGGIC